ncbi:ATP-dependent Clp protease ATP-binding subunit [Patescibacteria group bacterium]|nr:ATP-dependent Clp protease ATP-binding subunit [Patescibacteria group bacterium]
MLPNDLIGRFTTHLKEALQKALAFSVSNGREIIEPGDLIVGLLNEKGSLGGEILKKAGCDSNLATEFFRGTPRQKKSVMALDLSESVKKIIEKCVVIAHLREHKYIGTEHLLAALIESDDISISVFFKRSNIEITLLQDHVESILKSESQFPEIDELNKKAQESEEFGSDIFPDSDLSQISPLLGNKRQTNATMLDSFARNLTKEDVAELLDPVIGRDTELDRVIEVLIRRTKSNPILLGEPGVGKTAIVEGLAQRLVQGDVPDALHGFKILSLDLASTVAGTMYRGEFEARLKQIVDEARKDTKVILFIDEIHNIVGAGSTSGSLDAANILKPALSRGEIRCIGATTWSEYKKHIETDAALERRFQPIVIDEPSKTLTLDMLKGLSSRYAKHHNVKYKPETLVAAVDLADKFLTDRLFPDKAVDLLDEAAASVIAKRKSKEDIERLSVLQAAINNKEAESKEHLKKQDLAKAAEIADDADRLKKDHKKLQSQLERDQQKNIPVITPEDVARVVARMADVPLSLILATEQEKMMGLEKKLSESIIGQDQAIQATADIIRRARLGLQDPSRPKASMLFVGPSGTGKTELARSIANNLFSREDAFIKLDMSEFSEPHSISKLIGSPAGYVGYRESNKLTDSIRKRPHCIICFDEIEKAHPDVQHTLLQILEDGAMTDSTGRKVSFKHAYIILTSNVGSDQLQRKNVGFGSEDQSLNPIIADEIKARFKPELINRLDRIITFNQLSNQNLRTILDKELQQICERLTKIQNISCDIPESVRDWLMQKTLPPEQGARAIRRLVEQEITSELTKHLIKHRKKSKIIVSAIKNKLNFR